MLRRSSFLNLFLSPPFSASDRWPEHQQSSFPMTNHGYTAGTAAHTFVFHTPPHIVGTTTKRRQKPSNRSTENPSQWVNHHPKHRMSSSISLMAHFCALNLTSCSTPEDTLTVSALETQGLGPLCCVVLEKSVAIGILSD